MTDPKEVVRRGYDAISYAYRADDAADGHYGPWVEALRRHLSPRGPILDLGCGCGVPVSRDLAEAGHPVTGVDLSGIQIRRARRLVPTGTFFQGDATTVAFAPRSFAAVVCLFTLIHLPLDEQEPLMARIGSWLRPGGQLLATTGHTAWTGTDQDWLGAAMWWSHTDAATYRTWIERAGLRVQREEFFPEDDSGHTVFRAVRPC